MVDNAVIIRRQLPSHKSKLGTKRRPSQYLCLDKAYISEQEEQELIKRGYGTTHTNQEEEKERKREI